MGSDQIIYKGIPYTVVDHRHVAILQPTKEHCTDICLVFFNEQMIPTHIAKWNKRTVGTIMAELNIANQNMVEVN